MTTVSPSVSRCDGTSRSTRAKPVIRLGATARPATNPAMPSSTGEPIRGKGTETTAASSR